MNKYTYLYVVQGRYAGWEDLSQSESRREALADLRAYRMNEHGEFRMISRRERNQKEN
jgi:hypothetical protein